MVLYAILMVTLQFDRMPLPGVAAMVAAAFFIGTLPGWPGKPLLLNGTPWADRRQSFAFLALRGLWFNTAPTGVVLYLTGHDWVVRPGRPVMERSGYAAAELHPQQDLRNCGRGANSARRRSAAPRASPLP